MSRSFSRVCRNFSVSGTLGRLLLFFFSHLYRPSSRGCGNCGKLGALGAESFPSPVGTVEKSLFIFPPFPQGGSFHSLGPQWPGGAAGGFFRSLTARETDCYSWHGTETVTLH